MSLLKPWPVLFLALALLLTACENSITGLSESCRHTDHGGSCEGAFRNVSGSYTKRFEINSTFVGNEAGSDVLVSVERGALQVSLVAPDGTLTSAVTRPGEPVTLSGLSAVHTDAMIYYIPIIFEALEDDTGGVTYSFSYRAP